MHCFHNSTVQPVDTCINSRQNTVFTVIMGDSNLSASELRQRYHKGGSLPDSELSAKQIRARHAVPSNSQDFSTKHGQKSGGSATMIVGVVAAVAVVGAIVYFSTK
jgi:hypothetical protein